MVQGSEAIALMNAWGRERAPFIFFTSFLGDQVWLSKQNEVNNAQVLYQFQRAGNATNKPPATQKPFISSYKPLDRDHFEVAFQQVVDQINYGNSFLTNLTFQTPIELSGSLEDVFHHARAKYKLLYHDHLVCFSPETFIRIADDQIFSYPMKGTINADIPNAIEQILNDPKETAEHITIVDLIRNDLSQVAQNVEVTRFRYLDRIVTEHKNLYQVSSEIRGNLGPAWHNEIGNILYSMLPAGSISGAPKPRTVEIIQSAETYDREFYTGVCGIYDGHSLDSGVMIRFIQKEGNRYFYKSGGGITSFSDLDKEYQEYQDKIYVPVY